MATRPSPSFSKRNCDGIAFREGSKSSAISGMGVFRHYFPTVVQHACNMLVHGLHAREQPLPVVLPRPTSFVCKRLHFHLVTGSAFFLAPFPFRKTFSTSLLRGAGNPCRILGEHIAKIKEMSLKALKALKAGDSTCSLALLPVL